MELREEIIAQIEEILISNADDGPRDMAEAVVDELDIEVTREQVELLGTTEFMLKVFSGYWTDSRQVDRS